ncbi:MAG: GntR family transcriptional regulator [Gammaproteobacteria bacterium]|nr:GntR family transcriptional regulator [Gammaproteobacteria bacterium]MDH3448335.1 GntR family transcriptional regulator [Gammaproteobacteria bacterium]
MKAIDASPKLTEQVYRAILDDICDGELPAGTHLVQEQLADRLGVSRQPVQQAMALLKVDGIIEAVGKRGLRVTHLDLDLMRHRYEIRAVLDGLAARGAAARAHDDAAFAADLERRGRAILAAGEAAVAAGATLDQIGHDEAFHNLIYDASGNPFLAATAQPHWRFLRRVMSEVLRYAEPPQDIWRQHAEILQAVTAGNPALAEARALEHIGRAADGLDRHLGRNADADAAANARETGR